MLNTSVIEHIAQTWPPKSDRLPNLKTAIGTRLAMPETWSSASLPVRKHIVKTTDKAVNQ